MTMFSFRVYGGEIPRLPHTLLPENASQGAINCDLSHGELHAMRGNRSIYSGLIEGQQIKGVYSEDGVYFYAWAYDTWAVKSMTVDDIHYRLYYTQVLPDGPLAKVARTHRNDNSVITRVIGSSLVGGNFQPPEANTPLTGNAQGPDSWVLGVPAPRVQAGLVEDNLILELVDKPAWPSIPRLQLRVTFLLEAPSGEFVAQHDISNFVAADGTQNVWYDSNTANRGRKIQDMLWPLGGQQGFTGPRPYKYYWFDPPPFAATPIGRTITLTADASTSVEYGEITDVPTPGPGTEIPAREAGNES